MIDELNRIRNSNFSAGTRAPRAWEWRADGRGATWEPLPHAGNGGIAGVCLRGAQATSRGVWAQTFTTRKDQHYRIEAVVSCDCPGPDGGLVMSLTPLDASGRMLAELATAPLRRAERFTVRAYYRTAADVRRAELTIGLIGAGSASIHDVRVLPVLEPDARCHPWAIPPPPFALAPPVVARRIVVLTRSPNRPLITRLRSYYGAEAITVRDSAVWHRALDAADALLLLDGPLPARLKSLRGLKRYAEGRVVLVALPVMEGISGKQLVTRQVTQLDDPLHARVLCSDFPTAGFALRDIFPFAGCSDDSTRQAQRQFRVNRVFREYCSRHEFQVLLDSEADAEATSEKPIALIHRLSGGAIAVMDPEPAEAVSSSLGEPGLAMRIVLNTLGAPQPVLGQYITPARDAVEFQHQLRDTVERFGELSFADAKLAADAHSPQLIVLGREMEALGLPVVQRPLVLIRTGLTGADLAGAYGALLFLKQLLRPAPYVSPYANTLDRALRIGWMPLAAPLAAWGGWQPPARVRQYPIEIEFEPGSIAACIDVTTAARHEVRVVTCGKTALAARLRSALPALASQLLARRHFYEAVPAGSHPADARRTTWRRDDLNVEVQRDDDALSEPWQRSARDAGAELLRIELPATVSSDFSANSIWLTDWAATLLELVTGLMLGAVVVNREEKALTLTPPEPIAALLERAVLRRINAPGVDLPVSPRRDNQLSLPPATALVAVAR